MKTYIEGTYTTHRDIESCMYHFNQMLTDSIENELIVEAKQEVKEIDIQLIAYFMLFKDKKPNLRIVLSLPFNTKSSDSVAWKVRTYGTQAYLMMEKEVFRLILAGEIVPFEFSSSNSFPKNFFRLSENLMLMVFIKKERPELFSSLFENREHSSVFLDQNILPQEVEWNIDSGILYDSIEQHILGTADPKKPSEAILSLGKLAFYQLINNAQVLSIYMDPLRISDVDYQRDSLKSGSLQPVYEINSMKLINHPYIYYDQLRPTIRELERCSVIELFIMSTLMSGKLFPRLGKSGEDNQGAVIFKRLWGFTKELAYGLKELAKNIREHSTTHAGVIAGKIYKEEYFWKLLTEDTNTEKLYQRYMSHIEELFGKPIKSFLDIHVLDIGESGVIPQLLSSSINAANKALQGSKLEELLLEDVEMLKKRKTGFLELLNPTTKSFLNQQSKRSIAHYGLLMFNNLIIKSKGMLMASSMGINGMREHVLSPFTDIKAPYMPLIGTNYHIVLPVHPENEFESKLPQHEILPPETSALDIKGLEELFNFSYEHESNLPLVSDLQSQSKKLIIGITLPRKAVMDRDDEEDLWTMIYEKVSNSEKNAAGRIEIFNLDLDKTRYDESLLLRLLATWNLEFPKKSLIVTNIENKLFTNVLSLNDDVIEQHKMVNEENEELIFWNAKSAIIIYHYTLVRGDRFYFADSLFGKDRLQHLQLNKLIARTNFNFTELFDESFKHQARQKNKLHPYNSAFHNANVLLPLDIILTGGNGTTLFEQNSSVLLKNVIKPKNNHQNGSK